MRLTRCGLVWRFLVLIAGIPQVAVAEQVSFFQDAALLTPRGSLFAAAPLSGAADGQRHLASLFAGQDGASLFAPYPERHARSVFEPDAWAMRVKMVRHLIGRAEAGKLGYDAVQHGAVRRPDKRPTAMTIAEIRAWIVATPGQPHAIGRYQFIPATLSRLVARLGVGDDQIFTSDLQDRFADALLVDAGLEAFRSGDIGRHAFMQNMAKVWAGLPTADGKSYYDGFAGNKATMTWMIFDAEMAQIFPG